MQLKKMWKFSAAVLLAGSMLFGTAACGTVSQGSSGSAAVKTSGQSVIYTNADDEAVAAFKNALDKHGFQGKYIIQNFGTSELGGKLMAEGKNLEADLITMSSYYVDSAQEKNKMFQNLTEVKSKPLDSTVPAYRRPTTLQEGAIFVNTEALKSAGLPEPKSFKDLADAKYKGQISVPDIKGSSTAWLMVQAVLSAYGETEGKTILTKIYQNAGPHLESSGSAPLKNVRAGEVAVGFGLRQQAVADKKSGLPINYVDPQEGNFSLTESVAVPDKGSKTKTDAQKMAAVIIDEGRTELLKTYPNVLYSGEQADTANASKYPKVFSQPLTVNLLEQHQKFSEMCKQAAK